MYAVRYHRCTCHQRYSQQQQQQQQQQHQQQQPLPQQYQHLQPPPPEDNNDDHLYAAVPLHGLNGNLTNGNYSLKERDRNDNEDFGSDSANNCDDNDGDSKGPQPWYFHIVASVILVVHGLTFLVPSDLGLGNGVVDPSEDTDMVRTIAGWFGYEIEWVKHFTPYAQGLASVFNISLGIVSWWTPKDSERYNRLIQLRVFAFCINILHAYITGPVIYSSGASGSDSASNGLQSSTPAPSSGASGSAAGETSPLMAPGRIIGLFRLSYLTPGLMAAGVTEVIVEKEQEDEKKRKEEEEKLALEDLMMDEEEEQRRLVTAGGKKQQNSKKKNR